MWEAAKELRENEPFFSKLYDLKLVVARIPALPHIAKAPIDPLWMARDGLRFRTRALTFPLSSPIRLVLSSVVRLLRELGRTDRIALKVSRTPEIS
jgi:hypothetical protein